jgi:hypothetical protein
MAHENESIDMEQNRRKKTRVNFETQVVIRTKDAEVISQASSKNISLRGVFLETEHDLLPGTPCEVEILLTGTSSLLSIKVQGSVARKGKGGLGIAFKSIDPDSYFHLRNLLMYNTPDPDEIEREQHLH